MTQQVLDGQIIIMIFQFAFRYPIDKKQGADSTESLVQKHGGVNGEVKINIQNLKKNIDYFDDMLFSTYSDGECEIPAGLVVF